MVACIATRARLFQRHLSWLRPVHRFTEAVNPNMLVAQGVSMPVAWAELAYGKDMLSLQHTSREANSHSDPRWR